MFRAAAVQMSVTQDEGQNLKKCLERVEKAAAGGARLVVLPEFCHLPPVFRSRPPAHKVAVSDGHPFLTGLMEAARRFGVYVAVNAFEKGPFPQVLDTTFLLAPDGALIGKYHKHLLFGPENNWITPGRTGFPVFETPLCTLGMYTCMDGLIPEPSRCLALSGAKVVINCLNSAGPDEPQLHIPVRARENGVWIIAANKVGAIDGAPANYIGESMIVAPDGHVVAKAEGQEETIVFADIDPEAAKMRPGRRPDLYGPLFSEPPTSVTVSALDPSPKGDLVIGADLPVSGAWTVCEREGELLVHRPDGALAGRYRSVHAGGGGFLTLKTPFGVLGFSSGDDLWFPEAARVLGVSGVDLLIHVGPFEDMFLRERAAENRMVAVAVSQEEGRCGVVRLGPMDTDPHYKGRSPEIEISGHLHIALDLSPARIKKDQISGRSPECCPQLTRP